MARVLNRSQFYLHTPRIRPLTDYLPLPTQPKLVLIYRPRRDGRLSWPWMYKAYLYTFQEYRYQLDSEVWH